MEPEMKKNDWLEVINDIRLASDNEVRVLLSAAKLAKPFSFEVLGEEYGYTKEYYSDSLVSFAKKLIDDGYCSIIEYPDGTVNYLAIVTDVTDDGYVLKPELLKALEECEQKSIDLYLIPKGPENYWFLKTNPKVWSFSNIAKDHIRLFTKVNESGNPRRIQKYYEEVKPNDVVIAYESQPTEQVVALGSIASVTDKGFYFKKGNQLTNPLDYAEIKDDPDLSEMDYLRNPNGTLFKLKKEEYDCLIDKITELNPASNKGYEKYDDADFLKDVYTTKHDYEELKGLLLNNKNIILQGAPGVGKTFSAERLAYAIMGEKNESRVAKVQFHQNYSYEDFVIGYKPNKDGFELKEGIFLTFCNIAANDPDNQYFFIIDEINRGNLSKIFGELLMLIEKDYRGSKHAIKLAYNGKMFSVPENLYIIGMMNTADRSLAIIDYALRRRFSFFEMRPGFDSEGFKKYQNGLNSPLFDRLVATVQDLNNDIRGDHSLGEGFEIGHSYFCGAENVTHAWLLSIVKYSLVPMLKEYWFDDDAKWKGWQEKLLESVVLK
ncbi:MAG: AAA family ATPase [Erysipelotrichaceae bacterium]|nr:AAA family ATPase [Erysipelotrichaceae bacterium]